MDASTHFYGGLNDHVLHLRESRTTLSFTSTHQTIAYIIRKCERLFQFKSAKEISAWALGSKGFVLAA